MVFADAKRVQPNLIGVFDLFDQVAQTLRRADRTAGVIVCRREAINADFHLRPPYARTVVTGRARSARLAKPPAVPSASTIHVVVGVQAPAMPSQASSE